MTALVASQLTKDLSGSLTGINGFLMLSSVAFAMRSVELDQIGLGADPEVSMVHLVRDTVHKICCNTRKGVQNKENNSCPTLLALTGTLTHQQVLIHGSQHQGRFRMVVAGKHSLPTLCYREHASLMVALSRWASGMEWLPGMCQLKPMPQSISTFGEDLL
eukprot:2676427-Amphidinium_carterae.1